MGSYLAFASVQTDTRTFVFVQKRAYIYISPNPTISLSEKQARLPLDCLLSIQRNGTLS